MNIVLKKKLNTLSKQQFEPQMNTKMQKNTKIDLAPPG